MRRSNSATNRGNRKHSCPSSFIPCYVNVSEMFQIAGGRFHFFWTNPQFILAGDMNCFRRNSEIGRFCSHGRIIKKLYWPRRFKRSYTRSLIRVEKGLWSNLVFLARCARMAEPGYRSEWEPAQSLLRQSRYPIACSQRYLFSSALQCGFGRLNSWSPLRPF